MARLLAFPGSSSAVQREVAADFMKRTTLRLCRIAHSTADLAATIMLESSQGKGDGRNNKKLRSISISAQYMQEIFVMTEWLPEMASCLRKSLDEILQDNTTRGTGSSNSNTASNNKHNINIWEQGMFKNCFGGRKPVIYVSDEEKVLLSRFCNAVDDYSVAIMNLYKVLTADVRSSFTLKKSQVVVFGHYETAAIVTSGHPNLSSRDEMLFVCAKRCLKASEALKNEAVAAKPAKSSEDGSDGFLSKVRMLFGMDGGSKGAEKLSFPYMRQFLKSIYAAQNLSITGLDGNTIDAVLIPGAAIRQVVNQFSPTAHTYNSNTAKGIVLFCAPNAGFYESFSQADLTQSWLGFYASRGYDICTFNYRGYNRSSGAPSPTAVKRDGVAVTKYLQRELSPQSLIVHGESIGGMVACHIAKECNIDILICDRTFASLDAVAFRMMGSWAGYGVKYIGCWRSNVVEDYLSANCIKLIIQAMISSTDPDDQIISNSASLKNGVATYLTYLDKEWAPKAQGQDYLLAAFLNDPIPFAGTSIEKDILEEADMGRRINSVNDRFIRHLYACVLNVRHKVEILKAKKSDTTSEGSSHHHSYSSQQGSNNLDIEMGNITSSSVAFPSINPNLASQNVEISEDSSFLSLHSTTSSGRISSSPGNSVESEAQSNQRILRCMAEAKFASPIECLETYFQLSIRAPPTSDFSIHEKVLDGGTGQMFGQSLKWGLDGMRSWVASFIVWGSRSVPDSHLPGNRSDIRRSIADLTFLLERCHPQALITIERRMVACQNDGVPESCAVHDCSKVIGIGDTSAAALVSRDCCCTCGDHNKMALLSQMYIGVNGEKKQDLFFNKLLSIGT
eukprot:gene33892-43786_t